MKKVWCFNCYGVCIARMLEKDITLHNEKAILANEKIVSWRE